MRRGKKMVFNVTFDEMHVKQHKEWDKNIHSWKGLVDLGSESDDIKKNKDQKSDTKKQKPRPKNQKPDLKNQEPDPTNQKPDPTNQNPGIKNQKPDAEKNKDQQTATKALVFMLVNINGGFRAPVAYYLINSLNGTEKSILLKKLLIKLNEKKINVVSVTFDGDKAHKTACESLGANLNYRDENFKPYFEHPVTSRPVYIFYDPCHCLKLVRNYFATKGPIVYNGNEYIEWEFIKKLNKKQENEKLHCASKIRNRHVNFYKEKMKVFLAAQVLSNSTSKALQFNEFHLQDPNFKNSLPTANFCKKIIFLICSMFEISFVKHLVVVI